MNLNLNFQGCQFGSNMGMGGMGWTSSMMQLMAMQGSMMGRQSFGTGGFSPQAMMMQMMQEFMMASMANAMGNCGGPPPRCCCPNMGMPGPGWAFPGQGPAFPQGGGCRSLPFDNFQGWDNDDDHHEHDDHDHGSGHGHGGPVRGHGGPARGHGGPARGHGGPAHSHGGPAHGHGGPAHGHGGPAHGHGGPAHGHGGPAHGHGGIAGGLNGNHGAQQPPGGGVSTPTAPPLSPADQQAIQKREQMLGGMVAKGVTPEQIRAMAVDLKNFDLGTLAKLKASGVRIEVGNKEEFDKLDKMMQTSPAYASHRKEGSGGDNIAAAAFYDSTTKRAVFRPESLGQGIVRHELGHAVDDIAKKDPEKGYLANLKGNVDRVFGTQFKDKAVFRSDADPQLAKLFDSYKARTEGAQTEGGAMFSKYGRTNRQEYVAEAYRLYYGSSEEKAQLASADPGMFNYLKSQGLEKQS